MSAAQDGAWRADHPGVGSPTNVRRTGPVRPRVLSELVSLPRRSTIYPRLASALDAAEFLHLVESDLCPVPVRPTRTTSETGSYRARRTEPVDLRVSRATMPVANSFLHELGHFIDNQLGDGLDGHYASPLHPVFAGWRAVQAGIPSRCPAAASDAQRALFDSSKEVWARSYAQTVMIRSGERELADELEQMLADPAYSYFVWPADEFAPLAEAVEGVFAALGLAR
jgi:hypothetical protein